MQVQVHYQGLDSTQWADQFIKNKITKLNRYLGQSASAHVDVRVTNRQYLTRLSIHYQGRDYAFSADGKNLYEAFANVIDKATRALTEHNRITKDKIHSRLSPVYESIAS